MKHCGHERTAVCVAVANLALKVYTCVLPVAALPRCGMVAFVQLGTTVLQPACRSGTAPCRITSAISPNR